MRKKLQTLICLFLMLCVLCGCNDLKGYRPIDDINNLEGRRVGVALSWAPDYLLTGREDMTLMRYNTVADMITALCYNRLDAIAIERPYCPMIMESVNGVGIVEEPISRDSLVCYVDLQQEELLQQLNTFIAEFKTTDEYADLMERFNCESGYTPKDVVLTGGNKVLTVGIDSSAYPFSYVNSVTNEYEGSDIEFIKHFANNCGYELKFIAGSYEAMELNVAYGRIDLAISALSELWREDIELSNVAYISDGYMEIDIVFIEVIDHDNLGIKSAIDF